MKFRLPLEICLLSIGVFLMQFDIVTVIFTDEMQMLGYKTIQLWFIGLPIIIASLTLIVIEILEKKEKKTNDNKKGR